MQAERQEKQSRAVRFENDGGWPAATVVFDAEDPPRLLLAEARQPPTTPLARTASAWVPRFRLVVREQEAAAAVAEAAVVEGAMVAAGAVVPHIAARLHGPAALDLRILRQDAHPAWIAVGDAAGSSARSSTHRVPARSRSQGALLDPCLPPAARSGAKMASCKGFAAGRDGVVRVKAGKRGLPPWKHTATRTAGMARAREPKSRCRG